MFRPGRPFLDLDRNPIQAHAASILRHGDHWYSYGQDMGGRHTPADPSFTGISVYRSSDLVSWKRLGTALAPDTANPESPLHTDRIGERAKVIHNPQTNKFVMWLHLDRRAYDFYDSRNRCLRREKTPAPRRRPRPRTARRPLRLGKCPSPCLTSRQRAPRRVDLGCSKP